MDTIKHGTTGVDIDIASVDVAVTNLQMASWRERLHGVISEEEKRDIAWHVGENWPAVAAIKYFPDELRLMIDA